MSQNHSRPRATDSENSRHPGVARVYVIDDHRFFTFALTSLINSEADLAVCGSSAQQSTVVSEIAHLMPDIVVIDVNLANQDGLAIASAIRQVAQGVPILFLSSLQNPQFEIDSRWLEPCSFVEKTKDPVDIIAGIRSTLSKFRLLQDQFPPNH